MFTKLKSFHSFKVRDRFLADPANQQDWGRACKEKDSPARDALQEKFNAYYKQAKKEHNNKQKQIAKENVQRFLADPIASAAWLADDVPRGYNVGHAARWYGIASVKSKWFGKGTKCGKGTDYRWACKPLRVTVKIGPHEKTFETTATYRDHRDRDDAESYCVRRFIAELTKERDAE